MATTTSRPSHAPNVVLIVGTAPMIPQIRSQVRLLPERQPSRTRLETGPQEQGTQKRVSLRPGLSV